MGVLRLSRGGSAAHPQIKPSRADAKASFGRVRSSARQRSGSFATVRFRTSSAGPQAYPSLTPSRPKDIVMAPNPFICAAVNSRGIAALPTVSALVVIVSAVGGLISMLYA
jgi:hypothetical protein